MTTLEAIERGGSTIPYADSRPAIGSGPVERVRVATPAALPCEACLHEPVCWIAPKLEALRLVPPPSPEPTMIVITGTLAVECRQQLLPTAQRRADGTRTASPVEVVTVVTVDSPAPKAPLQAVAAGAKPKRQMSPEGRANIQAAVARRWAAKRAEKGGE